MPALKKLSGSASKKKYVYSVGLVLLALLMFVWPIPHTIALRHSLMLLTLLMFSLLAYVYTERSQYRFSLPATPFIIFGVLTFWMLLGSLYFWSDQSSIEEFTSKWLKGVLAVVLGFVVVKSVLSFNIELKTGIITAVTAPLVIHVISVDVLWLWDCSIGTCQTRLAGLTDGPDKASYLSNLLMAFLIAESVLRLQGQARTLPISNRVLMSLLIITFLSVLIEGMRNGLFSLLLVGLVVFFLSEWRRAFKRKRGKAAIAAILLGLTATGYFFAKDPRWATFQETIPIAWDTETHRYWLNMEKYPRPTLENGAPVDESNYLRVAWFKAALNIIEEHPLGVGYNKNAFGYALQQKYGEGSGHSHSGLMDFTIGTGILGALLWLLFLGSLWMAAILAYRKTGVFTALVLALVLTDYTLRMLVDSVIRDHMFEQFAFLAALLSSLMLVEQQQFNNHALK